MKGLARRSLAWAVAGALALPSAALAQPFYFLIGKTRPEPAPRPTVGLRVPPTETGATGFAHWNCREFPNCAVPYAIDQAGTGDVAALGEHGAIQNGFTSWQDVVPALIGFDRRANTPINLAQRDGANIMLWDGGIVANQNLLGGAGSSTLAITVIFNDPKAVILESDIVFNDVAYQWNLDGNNFFDVLTANSQPYAVNNGQTLTISVDGGANQTVTFAGVTNGAATANEVGQNIADQVAGVTVTVITGDRVRISSVQKNGTGTVNVNGGTAAAALAFPAGAVLTDAVDVESVAVHEIGHLLGIHHTSQVHFESNLVLADAIMYFAQPAIGTKRVLRPNDEQAANFLYTPDLGDAPDQDDPFNEYQTLVHGNHDGRVLNGVQLSTVGTGPEHLFGFRGPVIPGVPTPTPPAPTPQPATFQPAQDYSHDRYEWLGADMDDSAQECEARLTDADDFDDGLTLPKHLVLGGSNRVTVLVATDDPGGRYDPTNDGGRLHVNGYFDFDGNFLFDPADLLIWWSGVPGTTSASSANFVAAASNLGANPMVLAFDVRPPTTIPLGPMYARARLDLGEDEARVLTIPYFGGWEGDLGPATGAAQFGEVEDHLLPPIFDDFQCYEIERPPLDLPDVSLEDQFGPSTVTIKRAKRLCAPADKNGENPAATSHPAHYTAYTIKQTSPKFTRLRGVTVENQFGKLVVDVVKPDRLLVPTAKSLSSTPPPLEDPPDHFKCYRVAKARFRMPGIHVATQFGDAVLDIRRPLHLCAPADKEGEGIVDPDTHLTCYRVVGPRPQVPHEVFTLNQIGPDIFAPFGYRELCVPSSKRLAGM